MTQEAFVPLALITGVHGVRGEVKLRSHTDPPEALAGYMPLEDPQGRGYRLRLRGAHPFIAQIDGIADRNQAETLKGTVLGVPRHRLPAPKPDEYYLADLIGLAVVDAAGSVIGRISGYQNFGAGDLLEIERQGESALFPFTQGLFPAIDLQAKTITFLAPEVI